MKKINKFFYILAALSLAAVACQTKEEPFEPGPQDDPNTYGVFIPVQDASGSHTYDPSMDRKVDITVSRTNDKGDITVPFTTVVSDEGVFEFGDIKFADGQKETTLEVKFPKAGVGTVYSFSLTLTDDNTYVSKYGNGAISLDFDVLIVTWEDFKNADGNVAELTFNEGWWGEVHTANLKYYEVNGIRTCIATCNEGNGIWGDAVDVPFKFTWYLNKTNDDGYQVIDVPKQYLGFDYDDWASKPEGDCGNAIYFYDWYAFFNSDGGYAGNWAGPDEFYAGNGASYPRSYYDGNGGFYFNMRYYIPGLGGWTPDPFDLVAISDGFVRVDYSLSLETDFSAAGETPIFIEAGPDVASVKYAFYEGELNSAQMEAKVAGIADGSEKSTAFSDFAEDEDGKYATIAVAPEATGDYTLVMVAFDKDKKVQSSASVMFHHVAAGDLEELAVDINVFTEATPARYSEMTEYDSFAYGISGSNITEAHVYVVAASKYSDALAESVKNTADLALSADDLADLNEGLGGYYNVAGGLDPGTEYLVVVWATNGDLDIIVTASYETTASPEVWAPIGTGSYTDDFLAGLFGIDNLTWDVEFEQSQDDPSRFRMIYPYDGKFLYNEDGDWDTSKSYDIVISVPDATHVYIMPQEIGIDWGYGMTSIASTGGYYLSSGYTLEDLEGNVEFGTLADGVITFPEKGCVVSLAGYNGGSWLYANTSGACEIVLPDGVELAPSAAPKAARPANLVEVISAPVVKSIFERDPQSVQVKTTVLDAARKVKVTRYSEIAR